MSKKDPLYYKLHRRVHAARGRADANKCESCPDQAKEWAQIKGTDGFDPELYLALCRSCHREYDEHWDEATKAKVSESVKKTWADNPQRREFSEEHRANMRAAWERRKARTQGR